MFTWCMSRGPPPLPDYSEKNNGIMKKRIKEGYLLRYKRGFFCTGWCEEWFVLYEDSTLVWYTDKGLSRRRGFVRISDAPELLAVAEYTRQVPRKPRFPIACHIGQLLVVGSRKYHDVFWLMGQTPAEINDWMTAISNTLPPPPRIPHEDTRLTMTHKSMANGHAKPIANGCATIIPNGSCGSVSLTPPKTVSTPSKMCTCSTKIKCVDKKPKKFDNDHTVLAGTSLGVVMDWGHGWGWASQAPAVAPQITFTAEAFSSSLYCPTEDLTMTGYDDVDWSAFGDFCF